MKTYAKRWEEMAVAAHQSEPAVRSPRPVADDRIDKAGNTEAIQKVARESGTANHRARSNGRACIGECELENPDGKKRDPSTFISCGRPLQKEPVIADEAVAMAEHEGKADGIEQDAAKASINHAFHEHVHGFA